jgi:nucleoside-diphosphate-sugar epimerase
MTSDDLPHWQVLSAPELGGALHSRERDANPDAPSVPLYALSKLGSEGVAERYASLYGIEVVSVRFSDVYGPMDRDTGCMLIAC